MRSLFALVMGVTVASCTSVQPRHREALQTMQPISDPLVELLMRSEIPHENEQKPGTASDLGSALMSVKGLSFGTK